MNLLILNVILWFLLNVQHCITITIIQFQDISITPKRSFVSIQAYFSPGSHGHIPCSEALISSSSPLENSLRELSFQKTSVKEADLPQTQGYNFPIKQDNT